MSEIEPKDFELPQFTCTEVTDSRHFDKSEGFEVTLSVKTLADVITPQQAAWVCFSVQRALHEPENASNVTLRAVQFKNLFDDVQLMKVESSKDAEEDIYNVKLYFHWVRRFSEKLQ